MNRNRIQTGLHAANAQRICFFMLTSSAAKGLQKLDLAFILEVHSVGEVYLIDDAIRGQCWENVRACSRATSILPDVIGRTQAHYLFQLQNVRAVTRHMLLEGQDEMLHNCNRTAELCHLQYAQEGSPGCMKVHC